MAEDRAPAGTVIGDRPCVECGYNLKGRDLEGLCPECAVPVVRSISGDLHRADPAWLERLARGTRWLLAFFVAVIALFLVQQFLRPMLLPWHDTAPWTVWVDRAFVPAWLLVLAVFVPATMLVTEPEPRAARPALSRGWRRVVRIAAVLGLAGATLEGAGVLAGLDGWALGVAQGALEMGTVVALAGVCVVYRHVARRALAGGLARRATAVLWGVPLTLGTLIVLAEYVMRLPSWRSTGVVAAVSCAGFLAFVVFFAMFGGVLLSSLKVLTSTIRLARADGHDVPAP